MKIYDLREMEGGDALDLIEKRGAWVPAEVARGLYEALEVVYTLGLDDTQERIVEKALAAADGEEV